MLLDLPGKSKVILSLTQVLLDLPGKSKVILYTGLSALQKKYYKAILTEDLGMHDKRTVHMPYPAW